MTLDAVIAFWPIAVALAAAGAAPGVLAGLLGVGGGGVMVPVLFEAFGVIGVAEPVRMPLAVGTSLAAILPTALRSVGAHRKLGGVDDAVLKTWAIPVVFGVVVGAAVARFADPWAFKLVFIVIATASAVRLIGGSDAWRIAADLPKGLILRASGSGIGVLSALMGIGGGAIVNLVMLLHSQPIHRSVATASGVGVYIAAPGAIGYILAGWGKPDLPPDALGYVSLLGLVAVAPLAAICAPIGARLAHRLPKRTLELVFGAFLLIVALRFTFSLIL
ncbi:MAG: sulfite exporter TauE/SafE family protein [Pseudomonadota bacterium]